MANVAVPGGNKQIQLAEEEDGDSDIDEGQTSTPAAAEDDGNGQRPASQSLPRSCRLLQPTVSNGSTVAAAVAAYSARKVDSLPGNLVKRTAISVIGASQSSSSTDDSAERNNTSKKKSSGRLLKSFSHFMQKVARQLTSSINVPSFSANVNNGGNGNIGQSKTVGRQAGGDNSSADQLLSRDDSACSSSSLPLGVSGIHNHGNTCFMNAVLQCLANAESFASYLVTERYRADIRRAARRGSNHLRPGSTRGELTESLATLVKALWTRTMTSDISSDFRAMVARHGAQYRGSAQHDAQEFLLWLLDKVHEDVNIATKKKYRANKSSIGRPDEVVAAEALANHTRCNNSYIYDLFQALYRSSLTCPSCHHRSNTFDPFLSVSLPIPHKSQQAVFVTVVRLSSAITESYKCRYMKMGFLVDPDEVVYELRRTVAEKANVADAAIALIEFDSSGFRRTLCDSHALSDVAETNDVYAIEMPNQSRLSSSDSFTVVIVNKDSHTKERFGPVLVMRLSRDSCSADIKAAVADELSKVCQIGLPSQPDAMMEMRLATGTFTGVNLITKEVEFPLQFDGVTRALSFHTLGSGPLHLQLIVTWDSHVKNCVESSTTDYISEHESVQQVQQAPQPSSLCTLDECFQIYTQDERLGADDAWLCPNCTKYQQDAVKALSLWSLPEILVIHLKRFKQLVCHQVGRWIHGASLLSEVDPGKTFKILQAGATLHRKSGLCHPKDASQRCKLNTLVMFPVNGLDMCRHVQKMSGTDRRADDSGNSGFGNSRHGSTSPPSRGSSTSSVSAWLTWKPGRKIPDTANDYIYDLFAVCNHYGNMQGGHYTAFCKNAATKRWYSFNDSKASEMREEEVVTRAAYLLFYQRRSSSVASGDGTRDWLQQLQSMTNGGIPRTVTSHSLDNLLDSDGSTSSSHATEDASFHRQSELYGAVIRRASERLSANGLGGLTDTATVVDSVTDADDSVFADDHPKSDANKPVPNPSAGGSENGKCVTKGTGASPGHCNGVGAVNGFRESEKSASTVVACGTVTTTDGTVTKSISRGLSAATNVDKFDNRSNV